MYLNGYRILTDSSHFQGYIDYTGNGPWALGGTTAAGYCGFQGAMDDWRIENITRSDSYIQNVYQSGKPC